MIITLEILSYTHKIYIGVAYELELGRRSFKKNACTPSLNRFFGPSFERFLTQFVAEFGRRAVKEFTSTTLGGKETTSNLVYISHQRRQTCRQQLLSTGTCCVQSRKGASTSLFHPRQRHPTRQENSRHQRHHATQRRDNLLSTRPLSM